MAFAFYQGNAQGLCGDNVVENLDVNFYFSGMEAEMFWDFNYPFNCGPIPCPPGIVPYLIQYQFGTETSGGSISWTFPVTQNFTRSDLQSVHSFTAPIPTGTTHISYRVKINSKQCTEWEEWHTVQFN